MIRFWPSMTTTVSSDSEIGLKYGYRPSGLKLTRFGELAALVEERDLLKLLSIHGASARRGGEEGAPHRFVTEWFKLVNAPRVTQVAGRRGTARDPGSRGKRAASAAPPEPTARGCLTCASEALRFRKV